MSFLNIIGKEAELLEAARTGNLQTVEKLLSNKSKKSQHVGGAIGHKLSRYYQYFQRTNMRNAKQNSFSVLFYEMGRVVF